MALTEKDRYELGYSAPFYQEALAEAARLIERERLLRRRQVIKAQDMPWENSPHGRLKHLITEGMPYPVKAVNVYLMELPPGGRSGKHRHMYEEVLYILEGKGHDLHWDPIVEMQDWYTWRNATEPKRFQWEAQDFAYIPPMVAHQHFNADPQHQARFLAASNRLYKYLGYPDLEQLEMAPTYKP